MKLHLLIIAVSTLCFCVSKLDGAVSEDDAELEILRLRLKDAKDPFLRQQLQREIDELLKLRDRVTKTMQYIVALASDDLAQYERIYADGDRVIDFDCYKPVFNLFNKRCYNVVKTHTAEEGQVTYLVNMCAEKIPTQRILDVIASACKE